MSGSITAFDAIVDTSLVGGSVPALVLDIIEPDETVRLAARQFGVLVGDMVELDIAALYVQMPKLAIAAARYYALAKDFWSKLPKGPIDSDSLYPGIVSVTVSVVLVDGQQRDLKSGRVDLVTQCHALEHLREFEGALSLLDAKPSWSHLRKLGRLTRRGDRATFVIDIPTRVWPLVLGGPPCPGEMYRSILLETSHASWRDRRSRRLMRCQVTSFQVWPLPRV